MQGENIESICEQINSLNKGIKYNLLSLQIMCRQYNCKLENNGELYWVDRNNTPENIYHDIMNYAVVLTTLLEQKKKLEKDFPDLLARFEGSSYINT